MNNQKNGIERKNRKELNSYVYAEMIKSFNQLEMDVYNYIISNEEKVVYMKVRELAE